MHRSAAGLGRGDLCKYTTIGVQQVCGVMWPVPVHLHGCAAGLGCNVASASTPVQVCSRSGVQCGQCHYTCTGVQQLWGVMWPVPVHLYRCAAGLGYNVASASTPVQVCSRSGVWGSQIRRKVTCTYRHLATRRQISKKT